MGNVTWGVLMRLLFFFSSFLLFFFSFPPERVRPGPGPGPDVFLLFSREAVAGPCPAGSGRVRPGPAEAG